MKTRNGFVSNSSSSSFVILGKKLFDIEEATDAVHAGKDVRAIGTCLSDGMDIFKVSPGMIKLIKEFDVKLTCYEAYAAISEEGGNVILPAGVKTLDVFVCNADYHATDSESEFRKRYVN